MLNWAKKNNPGMILAFMLFLLFARESMAQEREKDYFTDALSNTTSVKIGESFRLIITAGAKKGLVRLPGENIVVNGAQLLGYKEKNVSRRHEGYVARQGIYEMKAFVLDQVHIPPFPIIMEWESGNSITAFTMPLNIKIDSMNPEKGFHLINPKNPLSLPVPWLMLTALAIILLGSLLLLFAFKTDRSGKQIIIPEHIKAIKELDALSRSPFLVEGKHEEYFVALSKLIRKYLAERYSLPALELSRTAIIFAMEEQGVEAKRREKINVFLKETDMVKFAMQPVTEKQIAQAHGMAREIIELTKKTTPDGEEKKS